MRFKNVRPTVQYMFDKDDSKFTHKSLQVIPILFEVKYYKLLICNYNTYNIKYNEMIFTCSNQTKNLYSNYT